MSTEINNKHYVCEIISGKCNRFSRMKVWSGYKSAITCVSNTLSVNITFFFIASFSLNNGRIWKIYTYNLRRLFKEKSQVLEIWGSGRPWDISKKWDSRLGSMRSNHVLGLSSSVCGGTILLKINIPPSFMVYPRLGSQEILQRMEVVFRILCNFCTAFRTSPWVLGPPPTNHCLPKSFQCFLRKTYK